MANKKKKKKRALTNLKQKTVNSSEKSRLRTSMKKVLKAVEAKDKEAAVNAYNDCNKLLDKAVSSHIKHKNYAARQKARLAKAVASID